MNQFSNQQVDMQYAEQTAAANSEKQDGVGTGASRADTTGGTEGGTALDSAGGTGDTVLTVEMLRQFESKIQVIHERQTKISASLLPCPRPLTLDSCHVTALT